jgi:hypothetical protein
MKVTKSCLLAILSIALFALPARAAIIFTGSPLSENFNGLPSTTPSPTPFSGTVGTQAAIPGTGWVATKIAGNTTAMPLIADDGTSNAGAIRSLGTTNNSERALGSLASGTQVPAYGVQVINNANFIVTEVEISFTQENWRTSTTTVNTIQASYSTSDAGAMANNFLSTGSFTDVDSLDLVGPPVVTTNGAINGNDPANQVSRSALITGLSINPGESFFLRFRDADEGGSDAALAIDNFTITLIPEPTTFSLMIVSVGAMLFRRK